MTCPGLRASLQSRLALGVVCLLLAAPDADGQAVDSIRWGKLMGERFIENRGQWPAEVRYAAGSGDQRVWVGERSVSFLLHDEERGRAVTVALRIEASVSLSAPIGDNRLPGRHHFLLGSDPDGWTTDVPAYESVLMDDSGSGLSLQVVPRPNGTELTLRAEPWATQRVMALRVEGATTAREVESGAPALETELGMLRSSCGECGTAALAGCAFCGGGLRFDPDGRVRWHAAESQEGATGTSKLTLEWSTLIEGSGPDRPTAVALAKDGSVVVAGSTNSMDFPVTPGAFDPTHAPPNPMSFDSDLFVARLTADGSNLVFSTYVGGAANDRAIDIVMAGKNEPTVLAQIGSLDYPTTAGSLQPSAPNPLDSAITRLAADGSDLVFSTYLGGSRLDVPTTMLYTADGDFVIVGTTCSVDYPTTPGAFDTTLHEPGPVCMNDGFVSKLSSDGTSLVFSTYLGNTGSDTIEAAGAFPDGSLALAGQPGTVGPFGMETSDFPITPRAFQPTLGSSFVARLSADGSDLLWSSFFGGNASNRMHGLGVDASGTVTVAGTTGFLSPSVTFPTTPGAFDETYNGQEDGFVARISADGTTLLSSTLLGSPAREQLKRMVVDPSGVATLLGLTDGGIPVTPGAHDHTPNGGWDFFVTRMSPRGDRLFYSTFVGGSLGEDGTPGDDPDLVLRPDGEVVFVGQTLSSDYPTTPGTFDPVADPGLGADGVVSQLSMLPTGVLGYGTSSPGCAGSLTIGVSSMPQLGNDQFSVWSSGAAPFASRAWLGLATAAPSTPLRVAGIDLWLEPASLLLLPARADAAGYAEVRLAVPNVPALLGLQVYAQSLWPDPCGLAGWAASRGLAVTVQP